MLKNVSMNVKQMGSYIIIILFFIVITNTSYNNVNHLRDQTVSIGEQDVPKIVLIGELKEEFTRINQYTAKYAFEQDVNEKNKMAKTIYDEIDFIKKKINKADKLNYSKADRVLLKDFSQKIMDYQDQLTIFINQSNHQDYPQIKTEIEQLNLISTSGSNTLEKLYKSAQAEAKITLDDSYKDSNKFNYEILILSVTASIFSTIIAYFTTRLISRTVKRFAQNVDKTNKAVAEIKKSIDITSESASQLDVSMNNANHSVTELVESIQQVAVSTNVTASGVDEISAAIEQMSASISLVAGSASTLGTSAEETSSAIQQMMASVEQVADNAGKASSGVEQISAAIEEMSQSIKMVSENARGLTDTAEQASDAITLMIQSIKQVDERAQTVNKLSNTVMHDAHEGTLSLNETLNGMKEISHVIDHASDVMQNLGKSSEEIGSIIAVIDEIADQTNLLALNAAIEAARAGEHGKGFSVVAEEVRKLAERSAQATKEISILIKGIQAETSVAVTSINEGAEKVMIGNKLADKTKQAIAKISEGITHVTEEMDQIARATEEQQTNSELITKAVKNVLNQTEAMTHSTKEQSITAEEIVKGIITTKNMVQQISVATNEQTLGGRAIVDAVSNVTSQTSSVTNATKEQAFTSEEIVKNVSKIKEMVQQMMVATNEQARYGQDIAVEVDNVRKQTGELEATIETQTKEVEDVAHAINEVNDQVKTLG
ncbi:chemotaxis protein [Bacillus sp. DNRA2]|uniref:methyl-accepting chemotaxis protein n=1 Tax=Bacillus sp. DNRA2 TaxID=2723053 RepID=UPI00145C4D30|nr:methyl-accepting chemotaxis protein [Bacillus sp. DNRA2]NMD69188.1 chemotaxis protein [Bacillus sp. DNRA2]